MKTRSATIVTDAVKSQWNAAAEGWDAHASALEPWLASSTATMISMAGIRAGSHVLDVAAGGGQQAVAIAAHVGREGRIICTDLSPALVGRLQANAQRLGLTMIEARVADAQEEVGETDAFDSAVCRLGLMLMPQPERCLRSVRDALRKGGRFSALVFAGPEDNPCIRILMKTALEHAGQPPRDPFTPGGLLSLGRPGHLEALFRAEGFGEVSTFRIDAPFRLPSVDAYVDFIRDAAAPVRAILQPLDPARREDAWRDIRNQLAGFDRGGEWAGPNTLLLATGRK
ncbi:MAG: class I SAM-dependent methyltransferase [Flavobacteriaceae bacterium]